MPTPSEFSEALARLDSAIAETEERLADLRLKRKGAEAFMDYMRATTPAKSRPAVKAVGPRTSKIGPNEAVRSVVRAGEAVTADDVLTRATEAGHSFDREQIRNALNYMVRKGQAASIKRGLWSITRDAESPSLASEGDSDSSLLGPEGGEHSNDESDPENHRQSSTGRNGDHRVGAPIGS